MKGVRLFSNKSNAKTEIEVEIIGKLVWSSSEAIEVSLGPAWFFRKPNGKPVILLSLGIKVPQKPNDLTADGDKDQIAKDSVILLSLRIKVPPKPNDRQISQVDDLSDSGENTLRKADKGDLMLLIGIKVPPKPDN